MYRHEYMSIELTGATVDDVVRRIKQLQQVDPDLSYGKYVSSPQYDEDLKNDVFLHMPKRRKRKTVYSYETSRICY